MSGHSRWESPGFIRGEDVKDTTYYDPKAEVNLCVDMALLTIRDGALSVLLVKRVYPPFKNCWALPGGYINVDESAEESVRRELLEETGVDLDNAYLEQLRTYTAPKRDPRGRIVSVAYVAFAPIQQELRPSNETSDVRWWTVEDLFSEDAPALAFDHEQIIKDALERCRSKLEYTTLATEFLTEPFSIGDLRRIYEAVWNTKLTQSNFHRKVKSISGFLVPVGESGKATLYRVGDHGLISPPIMREP